MANICIILATALYSYLDILLLEINLALTLSLSMPNFFCKWEKLLYIMYVFKYKDMFVDMFYIYIYI